MSEVRTYAGVEYVKRKTQVGSFSQPSEEYNAKAERFKRRNRAERALTQCTWISYKCRFMFMYLRSKQGNKSHSFPSLDMLAQDFGSRATARSLIKELEGHFKDTGVFKVTRTTGGKVSTSYFCADYVDFPLELVERMEQAQCKRKRRPTKMQSLQKKQDAIAAKLNAVAVESGGSKIEPRELVETPHFEQKLHPAMRVQDETVSVEGESSSVKPCSLCGEPATTMYDGRFPLCKLDGKCHDDAFALYPPDLPF